MTTCRPESPGERQTGLLPHGREGLLSRLSESSRQAIEEASRLSLEWGHERIPIELLLLAILQVEPEVREALRQAGVPVDEYGPDLERVLGRHPSRQATGGVELSAGVKQVLQLARLQASQLGQPFTGPEHLVLGMIAEGESFAGQFLSKLELEEARLELTGVLAGTPPRTSPEEELPQHLGRFTRDLTRLARAGELDPVIGRDHELERVIRVLSRRTKNNPVLIGEPGVGKTAIAEGLAQRIASGAVPAVLGKKRVLALDLPGVLAGARYRGEFEERLNQVMKELREAKGRYIVFIDEVHLLVGAGGGEGSIDASNMLKPSLARGELQCLGATTLDEYRRYIEKDAALERRFQPVRVAEPTPAQAIEILRGLRDAYEAHHRVKITDPAIAAAVELSDRYVRDRFLPDKAIDLMDEAAAMARLGAQGEPGRGPGAPEPLVTPEAIATIVSEWTGIPARRLRQEESERLLEMERTLGQRVVGQEEALRAVSEAVRRARTGLKDPDRPIGSFVFLGPTGVGKTETARALADHLFNDERALIRFDMSEYMERHAASRLLGAPPGYVGYEDAGKLTEAVRRRPYSVVLFDEIEKAHPDVLNLLLQILDDGRLTDSRGRTVDFKNTVLILTSNVGAQPSGLRGALGFQATEDERGRRLQDAALSALREQFRPELLNRIDELIVFQPLTRAQLNRVVERMVEETCHKLRGQNLSLVLSDAARDALVERGFDPKYGARPLRRTIQRELETPISRLLLRGEVREGDTLRVELAEGHFSFVPEHAPAPVLLSR